MKITWILAAGTTAMALGLSGCDAGSDAGSRGVPALSSTVSTASRNNATLAPVTWRANDKTAEFLSGFRAKD